MNTAESLVEQAVAAAHAVHQQIAGHGFPSGDGHPWESWREAVAAATGMDVTDDTLAALLTQSIVCSAAVSHLAGETFREPGVAAWLEACASPLWRPLLHEALALGGAVTGGVGLSAAGGQRLFGETRVAERGPSRIDAALYFYERFLNRYDSRRRVRHGVFYTPRPVAAFVVDQVHRALADEFGLPDGLADLTTWQQVAERHGLPLRHRLSLPDSPFVTVLDPALGSGVFLVEVILRVHRHWTEKWHHARGGATDCAARWDDYVVRHLLPRLAGLELLLPACVLAELLVALALAETGFRFRAPAPVGIHLLNTLAGPQPEQPLLAAAGRAAESHRAALVAAYQTPFTVILGNPPFSGISQQRGRWIKDLLRGRAPGRTDWADYYRVDGLALGERKLWLQDDYVKFLRFAHWKIESAGYGLVGLVTNHGYLDNPTCRGVRHQLLRTFPHITVLDLHGNLKKRERAPDGTADQSVFEIGAGTAIGIFSRSWRGRPEPVVQHGDLWGPADQKLAALAMAASNGGRNIILVRLPSPAPLPAGAGTAEEAISATVAAPPDPAVRPVPLVSRQLVPQGPRYLFVPRATATPAEYERGFRLPDIMPLNVTAPVTARDRFVVAFDEAELLGRMREFRDLSIADDEIRRRYFTRGRSPRYVPGDTRGWRLAAARRRMADAPDWDRHVRPCWYRPFDRRAIYWTEGMIDWPRGEVTQHLLAGPNLALIARRQMLPTQPCNYFWVTDGLTVDGVIRSDNRGSESIFPLYLYEPGSGSRRANFHAAFLTALWDVLGVPVAPAGRASEGAVGPEDVLHYIYALFFSSAYRERYADMLRADFPRVLLPARAALFFRLSALGARLVAGHLLRPRSETEPPETAAEKIAPNAAVVARGFPKYRAGQVWINEHTGWAAPADVWEYCVGGHQVCRKWLKDRRGKLLGDADLNLFWCILSCIRDTLQYARTVDDAIADGGGFTAAFR